MKQIYLHVGFHKTATSSFQETCANNQKILLEQGIYYPLFYFENKTINNHSIPFYSLFSRAPEKYHINVRWGCIDRISSVNEDYRKQIDEALNNHDKVLISGEDISMLPIESLERLRDYLHQKGFKVTLLCSVRKPYSFTCSALQEQIKGGHFVEMTHLQGCSRSTQVKNLQNVFENVIFSSFESDCKHEAGPIGALFERLDIIYSNMSFQNTNEGLGNISTRLYWHINKLHPIIVNGKLNPKGRTRAVFNFDDEKFLLTQQELNSVKNKLDIENRTLRALLGKDYSDEHYPISQPFKLSFPLAIDMVQRAARPTYTQDAVMQFVCQYKQDDWQQDEIMQTLRGSFSEDTVAPKVKNILLPPSESIVADCANVNVSALCNRLWQKIRNKFYNQ